MSQLSFRASVSGPHLLRLLSGVSPILPTEVSLICRVELAFDWHGCRSLRSREWLFCISPGDAYGNEVFATGCSSLDKNFVPVQDTAAFSTCL